MNSISQGLSNPLPHPASITESLDATRAKGDQFQQHVGRSKRKISLIETYEKYENCCFRLAFALLLATVIYFVLKRFWLHEVLGFVSSSLYAVYSRLTGATEEPP